MKQVTSLALAAFLAAGAVNASAYEAGDWVLRLGATTVAPDEDSDSIVLPTSPATVLPGVSIDNDTQLGIIPVYMLTDNWGVELCGHQRRFCYPPAADPEHAVVSFRWTARLAALCGARPELYLHLR